MPMRSALRLLASWLLLAAVWDRAQADTVDLGHPYPGDNVIVTAQDPLRVTDFTSTVSGTVTLTVKDMYAEVHWGDLLSTLSTSISLFSGEKLQLEGNATTVFFIGANQRFTSSVYAVASGAKGFGLYSLDLAFSPSAAPVPLPIGALLLLSGVGALCTRLRRTRLASLPAAA